MSIGKWPIVVGTEYDDDGPQLLCNARIRGLPCGAAINGACLDDLHADLAEHVKSATLGPDSFRADVMKQMELNRARGVTSEALIGMGFLDPPD
jgi:hypothetical protein